MHRCNARPGQCDRSAVANPGLPSITAKTGRPRCRATRLVTRLGQIGFPGKGVALAGVGGLLIWAAVTFDPSKAQGLDGALRGVLDLPFGRILLTLVAVGIAAFGAFCFVRARYPERT